MKKKIITVLLASISLLTYAQKQSNSMNEIEYSNNDVAAFLYDWFAGFDHQKNVDFFLTRIAEPVDMSFPDFPIRSKNDFKRWYGNVLNNIVWNKHSLQNLEISGNQKNGWQTTYNVLWKAKDKNGKDIEMSIHQDVYIVRKGDLLQIAKHRAYIRNEENQDTHLTALMKAAGTGNVEKVKDLINKGANIFTLDPITGTSVVHLAAQGGNVEVMKVLIANGAESIINLQAASNGFTPLMVATWYQNTDMICYLLTLNHTNPLIKDQSGRTAADFPVVAKGYKELHPIDKEIVAIYKDYFSKREKYISEEFENDGITPKKMPANVNIRIPNGNKGMDYHTAALVAARDNNIGLFRNLVNNGADLTAQGEYMKANVAHKAAYMGNPQIMKIIVTHSDFDKIKNAQGPTNGYTPLHDAIWHGHTDVAKILINAGVDSTIKAWDGMTPLDLSQKLGYADIVDLLK